MRERERERERERWTLWRTKDQKNKELLMVSKVGSGEQDYEEY